MYQMQASTDHTRLNFERKKNTDKAKLHQEDRAEPLWESDLKGEEQKTERKSIEWIEIEKFRSMMYVIRKSHS